MLSEIFPAVQNFAYVLLIALIGFFSFRHIIGLLKVRYQGKVQIAKHIGQNQSPITKYDSAHDLLVDMEKGLEIQVNSIRQACASKGVDPMKDIGFNTTLANYQKVISYREKFESNPLFMVADNLFWPAAKQMMIHMPKAIKEMLSIFG